jgi:hypothetical protein
VTPPVATAPPPAQLSLLPARPGRRQTSYRVAHLDPATATPTMPGGWPVWSDAVRDLPTVALRAARTAELHGEAWIVAADGSSCHVDAAGAVAPITGWARLAARTITNKNRTTPR